jgi:hypothetical protein
VTKDQLERLRGLASELRQSARDMREIVGEDADFLDLVKDAEAVEAALGALSAERATEEGT